MLHGTLMTTVTFHLTAKMSKMSFACDYITESFDHII